MNISSIVITKNEEKNISRCIKSLSFSDEIIVIDDYSEDKTLEIINNFPKTKVFKRKLNNNFADQKNFGLSKAKGKWILFIDADEEIPISLRNEIIQVTSSPFNNTDGYIFKRKDVFYGKKLNFGEWGKTKLVRLIKNGCGKWKRNVHEYLSVNGKTKILRSYLLHYSHQNLNLFIKNINYFSTLHAVSNKNEGKKTNMIKIISYPIFKFIQNWILKGGFKDNDYGFIMSLMMSFHSFLGWAKLWEEKNK